MARKPGIVTSNGRRSTPLTERKLESRRRSWEDNHSPHDLGTNRTTGRDHVNTKKKIVHPSLPCSNCSTDPADQTGLDWQNPPLLLYPVVFVKIKCGIILVKLKSLTNLQVLSSQKSPEDPEEETVERSLSKQSEVEKQSRRSVCIYLDGKTLQRIFFRSTDHSQNITNESRTRILRALTSMVSGYRREPSVQLKSKHTDEFGGIMEADTFWSAAAISPKSFGVFYG
ncbi:hypothetical protein ALC62_11179 [Cyphomyrmex costatus]|uniref:Uncharacterized protein n=1 Tax=Cyphomyrmex costatus TaxID=456900 RepID=A0A195CDQ2_9HYME|nr:hypothetical protein ALC62_11179 [Cyphomyrmex costatus]